MIYILKKKKIIKQENEDIIWSKGRTEVFIWSCSVTEIQKLDLPFNGYFSLFNLIVPY